MAKKLNTIQQRNYNNLLTAVESNDRTTAKEVFDRFFKGKESVAVLRKGADGFSEPAGIL